LTDDRIHVEAAGSPSGKGGNQDLQQLASANPANGAGDVLPTPPRLAFLTAEPAALPPTTPAMSWIIR